MVKSDRFNFLKFFKFFKIVEFNAKLLFLVFLTSVLRALVSITLKKNNIMEKKSSIKNQKKLI